jgi:hypothetical protein
MKEIISKIEEVDSNNNSGYLITTNKQKIEILIDNLQDCCEEWGYVCSEDNPNDFIGAKLLNIVLVDEGLKTYDFVGDSECTAMFINLETDKGLLQFVLYNIHNGYYGHEVRIRSHQLNCDDTL